LNEKNKVLRRKKMEEGIKEKNIQNDGQRELMPRECKPYLPDNNKSKFFRSIIKIDDEQLTNVFNYFLKNPGEQPHAESAWRYLGKLLTNLINTSDDDMKKEIKINILEIIPYLLSDSFDCTVPPFIHFEFTPKIESGTENVLFQELHFGLKSYVTALSISRETHSGW
jgi:hypothetical protein